MDDPKQEDARRLRAEKAFKRQEEGAKAMSEYEAEGRAVRAKTARLRAQRLEKEAKDRAKTETIPPKKTKVAGRSKFKKAGALAEEFAGQEIDRLSDRSATSEQRASRKRRLLKGPKEFRAIREDLPKRKT
jgi:hypothetical protein